MTANSADPILPPRGYAAHHLAAAVLTLVLAAFGYLALRATPPAHPAHQAFDANAAMDLAGAQVPPEVESFYFFILNEDSNLAADTCELAEKLILAAAEHEFLGIIGPDPQRNRRTLLGALEANHGKNLAGVIVIYLGPAEDQNELKARVSDSGAELRFVEYPALPQPI